MITTKDVLGPPVGSVELQAQAASAQAKVQELLQIVGELKIENERLRAIVIEDALSRKAHRA